MAMQKLLIVVAFAALYLLAEAAHAKEVIVKLTQQQVATTCGKLMVTGEGGARGCRKGCGDGKTCGYGCDKNGKNCYGRVVEKIGGSGGSGGSRTNPSLQGGILDGGGSPALGTRGPAATGALTAPASAAPAQPGLR
jgi:hypothetical protein